ncbi:hypothetical protein [Mongoliitalea lutea]|uniref:Outer membrane protein beta-barrel domain-containing protein n=1 Tax=Mongoliitalea lutea TaxID=849756 RepID=A0A8J3D168_9BACT|nr:hypothetical protein [Mongoliitalea lutea]GHB48493.1 hypothetical protein GCM10008106_31640 [Mongoliitalea lutea]
MRNILIIFVFLVVVAVPFSVQAQNGSIIAINYAPALPLGNTANFASNFTGRGVSFETYFMKTKNSGFGIELVTNGFADKRSNESVHAGTVTVTGNQFRAGSATSIMPTYIFVIGDNSTFKPFLSLGTGLSFLTHQRDMGIFVQRETATHVAVRPEVGAMFKISDYVGIKVSSKYYQTFGSEAIDAQSFIGFNLGFVMLNF